MRVCVVVRRRAVPYVRRRTYAAASTLTHVNALTPDALPYALRCTAYVPHVGLYGTAFGVNEVNLSSFDLKLT